jgi:predicted esterase
MNKFVLINLVSAVRLCALIIVFFSHLSLSAQSDCVDYDIGSYPKKIENTWYEWNPVWNFTNLKQIKRTGLNVGTYFKGLLEYKPASYSAAGNQNKKYPVIIFFHGYGSRGTGTAADLCKLFKDKGSDLATHLAIPGRVERNNSLFTQPAGEETMEFLVISPQFDQYTRSGNATTGYPSFNEVEKVIDYVEQNYRVDPRRIYLTGLSNGANMIMEYAASSLDRAKRIAAVMPVALCSRLDHESNTSRGIDAKYIGQAKLKTWFVYCEIDGCGATGTIAQTDLDVPNNWVSAISAVPGAVKPRYTILTSSGSATAQLYNCSDTLLHDAWSRAYDPNFKASFNYPSGFGSPLTRSNDNQNQNIYEWFAQQQSAVLPVTLKEFTARLLSDRKVELKWITTDEKNNALFTIERAGGDQKFTPIASIPGGINNIGEKVYSYTDANPLSSLSFYRLVQTDVDGTKTYFEIRKILNQAGNINSVIVSPNPFTSEVSAFLTVEKSQKVSISLTDMNGRILKTSISIYSRGMSEVKINSSDLPKGVYLLKMSGENFSSSKKVIKN